MGMLENNHPSIMALRKQIDAEKLDARVGLTPNNPKVSFSSKKAGGNSAEIITYGIEQEIDFPTVYFKRNKVSKLSSIQLDNEYVRIRQYLLSEAKKEYYNAVYLQKQADILKLRLEGLKTLLKAWEKRLASGDISIIEMNKIRLEYSMYKNTYSQNMILLNEQLAKLKLYCGEDIILDKKRHSLLEMSKLDLIQAYRTKGSDILIAKNDIDISKAKMQLSKAVGLPTFSIGFESEESAGVKFQGPTLGMSIPLWQNKNKVKAAKARMEYSQISYAAADTRMIMEIASKWESLKSLKNMLELMNENFDTANSLSLLEKSLKTGNISIIEYFNQLEIVYNIEDKLLSQKNEYNILHTDLYKIYL
jgi:outer membrane protein TolC